ncbi:capsid protein [Culex tritaeniorhynchus totivirus]|uniref:capsid protein n=1 Tax=Culex tritaeniorhynchus totivirus TaxID=1870981 RepID=UPI0008273319|nr:capsid protein [Culex tritaeniorhynchus totivirus]ANZ93872.1 capsid protein [Culex tritaeniorhynchus totivirus]
MNPKDHSESGRRSQSGSDTGPSSEGRGVATSLSKMLSAGASHTGGQTCNTTSLIVSLKVLELTEHAENVWVPDLTTQGIEPNPGPFKANVPSAPHILEMKKLNADENDLEFEHSLRERNLQSSFSKLKHYVTLSNGIFVGKVIILGTATYVAYKMASGVYGWYHTISAPIAAIETSAATEYHTLQTKYGYQWYDYLCPMCLLSKYIANSNNNSSKADHHNHLMHALNGNIVPARCVSQGFASTVAGVWAPSTFTLTSSFTGPQRVQVSFRSFANSGNSACRVNMTGALTGSFDFALQPETIVFDYVDEGTPQIVFTPSGVYASAGDDKGITVTFSPIMRTPTEVTVSQLPLWTTQYGPNSNSVVPTVKTQRTLATRNRTRNSENNAISVLNQIAQQDLVDKRLPLYSNFVKAASDDKPNWSGTLVYRNVTVNAVNKSRIHDVKTDCAAQVLRKLDINTLNNDQRATLSAWVKDLTTEGIEPNPGPQTFEGFDSSWDCDILTPTQLAMLRNKMDIQQTACIMNDDPTLLDDAAELKASYIKETKLSASAEPAHVNFDASVATDERNNKPAPPPVVSRLRPLSEYIAHASHLSELNGAVGDYFGTLCTVFEFPVSNRFSALANCDNIELEPVFVPAPYVKPKRQAVESEPKQRLPTPSKPRPKPKTEEEKEADRKAAIKRIVMQLTQQPARIVSWITRSMSINFKITILDQVFGNNWQSKIEMNQYEWVAYCDLNNVSIEEKRLVLLSFDSKYKLYDLKELGVANSEAVLAAAKTHNKVMHAYNGNPVVQTFEQIKASKSLETFFADSDSVLPPFTGMEAEKFITNIVGDINPNQSRIFDQDRLRANIYTADGTIIRNAVSTIPFTNIIPRTVRGIDGVQRPSTNRLQITECNVAEYFVNPIEPTDLSMMISDQIKNNQSSNWRRDNNSIAGFNSFDIATVNTALLPRGLSLESMLLRLDLLHSIMALQVNGAMIGRSLFQVVDDNTIPADTPALIGVNNSPVFGEDCGGSDPVYPWLGGKGIVAFHLTLQSVPEERRDMAIFLPPALLQAARDGAEAIALFVLSMSEWPFCLYTVAKDTTDIEGLNPSVQISVPTQATTRVGGSRVIDVVLPRRYPASNPTSMVDANALSVIRPQAGPLPTNELAGNELLNVNYISPDGGATIEYPLTDYLYTWATQFDITTIRQYVGRLGAALGIKKQLWACHEINVALCQVTPKMTVGTTGSGSQAPGSPQQASLCYSSHLAMTRASSNFPLQEPVAADFRVFETFPGTWNKVALGLATAPNLTSEQTMSVPFEMGDPRANFWERLEAIPIAASWALYYHSRGSSSKAWNNAYTNTTSVWMQNLARKTFSTSQATGTILPARFGRLVRNIMRNMFCRQPATITTSIGGEQTDITAFERWLPGNEYATTFDETGREVTLFPPVIIPDIWVQYFAQHTPQMAGSYPVAFGYDSVQGFSNAEGLIPFRNVNNNLISTYIENDAGGKAYYPIREGPTLNDKVVWNSRLWMTEPNCQYLDFAGNDVEESLPPPGCLPLGKSIPLLPGETEPHGVTNMATTCVPRFSNDGRRIFVYLTAAQSTIPILACKRAARLPRSTWLVQEVYAEPALQLLGDESDDIFDKLTSRNFLDVQSAAALSAVGNVPATKEMTDRQAVDPANLPSTLDKLTEMPQPAPLLASSSIQGGA